MHEHDIEIKLKKNIKKKFAINLAKKKQTMVMPCQILRRRRDDDGCTINGHVGTIKSCLPVYKYIYINTLCIYS